METFYDFCNVASAVAVNILKMIALQTSCLKFKNLGPHQSSSYFRIS